MAEGDLPAVADETPAAAPPVSSPPAPSPGTRIARPRTRYPRLETVARQLGTALLTLLVISIVTFAATNIKSPTDVARNALGRETSEAQLQAYVREHGLDKPIYARYGKTLTLSLVALVVALPISILIGVFMARRVGSWEDLSLLIGTVVLAAMPEFVVGIGLLMLFAVTLHWLPVDSTALSFGTTAEKIKAYVLPMLTLVLAMVPYIARIARGAAGEALAAPYTQAALLRGLPRRTIIWDHAMRNAAVPLVNAVAINLVYLLSGVIVVENVFAFPGIGQALVQAISQGDTITVQAIALVMGAMFIAISLAADLLVVYFNPRLKAATA